ncbi:MAG: aspartate--tRNA ligase [Schleiferiaceae bacterium]|nr:aspartate--tRNA ligase [Schleiferiaceae bacterium]MDR9442970.1 aspartate--tRNA ligase [Schleiferiaceae bacterium]
MYRTHTCGELRAEHLGETVELSGWVQRVRELGGMTFVDLRDRYGITQLTFNESWDQALMQEARRLGREFVVHCQGEVVQRENPNPENPTGQIEIKVAYFRVLSRSEVPPFTIETDTDGGEELRMKYRYLDLRRPPLQRSIALRHQVDHEVRHYLREQGFFHVDTPYLIKSTPEGARDFVVPSRLHEGQFYALPQSPQTFKQLLMISGYDRYYQIVRCFRDEDFRADRQPEFTQIDCEMSFVEQSDVLRTFEGLTTHLLRQVAGDAPVTPFPRLSYQLALERYGTDKPDIRFDMTLCDITTLAQGAGFKVFDQAQLVTAIRVEGQAGYTRKQLDALTAWVQRPQVGAKGLIWVKHQADGSFKSSVDKFFGPEQLHNWAQACESQPGDLLLVMAGETSATRKGMGMLRLHLADELGLRKPNQFAPLWVTDFPLLEWEEESQRYHAMHHPFTAPRAEDLALLDQNPEKVRAQAYDLVLNGNELGGGSIRIHDRALQEKMFAVLGFSEAEAQAQFGFLLDAFRYGAPPHGGMAFGFDRLVALLGGSETIRDYMAFPKNNAGRDLMIDAPAPIDGSQWQELHLRQAPQSDQS